MPTVNISVDLTDNELNAIKIVANKNRMTAQEYAESVVRSAVKQAIIGFYKNKFNKLSIAEMEELIGEI